MQHAATRGHKMGTGS